MPRGEGARGTVSWPTWRGQHFRGPTETAAQSPLSAGRTTAVGPMTMAPLVLPTLPTLSARYDTSHGVRGCQHGAPKALPRYGRARGSPGPTEATVYCGRAHARCPLGLSSESSTGIAVQRVTVEALPDHGKHLGEYAGVRMILDNFESCNEY
jgi:hypothetical protein